MIRYRAAAFWGRLFVPELLVGIQAEEEVIDIQPVAVNVKPPAISLEKLNEKIKETAKTTEAAFVDETDELF